MASFAVVNPRRRRRRKATRRRRRSRARARSNPANPFRRRRRRRYRRNPSLGRLGLGGLNLPAIGWGVAGAVGVELGGAAATNMLPDAIKGNQAARLGLKAALVVVGSMIARRVVGPSAARAMALGGGISVGLEAVRTWVLPMVPGLSDVMGEYLLSGDDMSPDVGAYLSGGSGRSSNGSVSQFAPQWGE